MEEVFIRQDGRVSQGLEIRSKSSYLRDHEEDKCDKNFKSIVIVHMSN